MKAIAILGSTGSIGRQTLEIVSAHRDALSVVAVAAGRGNLPALLKQIEAFSPELVSVADADAARELRDLMPSRLRLPEIVYGEQGLIAVATHPRAETLVTAVVGFLGVVPTACAIEKGKRIALANKETLVAAGSVIMPLAQKHGAEIVPVDSEHSAIHQSLAGHKVGDIRQIWLTASGGPFRTWTRKEMAAATVGDALKHPNWSMGPKITVDSATLMNKGLEIIEARWLFAVPPSKVKVVIHPQSILHSAVEFVDGSVIGQMGLPDMRLPIHYALFCPQRQVSDQVPRLNLTALKGLTFEEPDEERFPCLALARHVAGADSTEPCVLNAANEVAVEAFLNERIRFLEIPHFIEKVLAAHRPVRQPSLKDILDADRWARAICRSLLDLKVKEPV